LQFFHFKERAYLHYVGYISCVLLYFLRSWGFGTKEGQIILYQIKHAHQGEIELSAATMILYVIFIRSFLNIDKPSAGFVKVTRLIIIFSIFFGGVGFFYGLIWNKDWVLLEVIYKSLLVPLELVRDFVIERGRGNFVLDKANFAEIAGSYLEKIQRSIK